VHTQIQETNSESVKHNAFD